MRKFRSRLHSHRFARVVRRSSGRVPHWELDEAFYSITYRLADALPRPVLEALLDEKRRLLKLIVGEDREPTREEEAEINRLFGRRLDRYLDRGMGACHLRDPRAARIVVDNLSFFDADRYRIEAWCVMPNHVHVVMFLHKGADLAGVLHSWKSYTSNRINEVLGREGTLWQKDYFDRLVRDEQDLAGTIRYVVENPSNAGLVGWKWVGRR